ncbi:ABC transporter ATP-binding protein [Algoriphagus litoralis]|uniref:ABC transporter ATP-binding protein n=1 Tax=Algoriphagus litoralis TaxID=2202829 RepID=UPI000DB9288D|nr:ABC transporter ATP-binding protein [Algoriphagus litoralis]
MSFFSIRQISKTYDSQTALQPFSLELKRGELIAIVGESGSGKSTLLRIMAGLEMQSSGAVLLNGQPIENPAQKLIPGYDEIKLIHQDFQLNPNSTVTENISRPLIQYDKGYSKDRLVSLLFEFGLEGLKDRFPRQLSGGQQQKVAIAAALAVEPEVLLLDEPFSSLDPIQKHKLITELKELFLEMGTTVVFVTHDLDDALRLTDNLIILQKGKVVQKGGSQELCEHPKTRYVARLFSTINLIPDRFNSFLRPSDVRLRSKGELLGHVIDQRFLVHYNSLQVRLKNGGQIWEVDDPLRKYKVGDRVYLCFDEEKVLVLKG